MDWARSPSVSRCSSCGTGQALKRNAHLFPGSHALLIDGFPAHDRRQRAACPFLNARRDRRAVADGVVERSDVVKIDGLALYFDELLGAFAFCAWIESRCLHIQRALTPVDVPHLAIARQP